MSSLAVDRTIFDDSGSSFHEAEFDAIDLIENTCNVPLPSCLQDFTPIKLNKLHLCEKQMQTTDFFESYAQF
jgi:hypothetical protein